MPPRKPKSRKVRKPRAGAGRAVEAIDAVVICHPARSSPFGFWEKTTRPVMDDKFLPDDSMGIRKTISFLLRDSTVAPPGMQIFSQTSQLASATSFIVEFSIFGGGVISWVSRTSSTYP